MSPLSLTTSLQVAAGLRISPSRRAQPTSHPFSVLARKQVGVVAGRGITEVGVGRKAGQTAKDLVLELIEGRIQELERKGILPRGKT